MSRRHLESLVIFAVLVATSLFAYALTPSTKLADSRSKTPLQDLVPLKFGDWVLDVTSPIVLPSADVQSRLNSVYNQILTRTYISGAGYRIMLSIAYGGDQSDGLSVHRPELCYPSQGFEVSELKQASLSIGDQSIPVMRLETRSGSRIEPVTYWIVNGDVAVASRLDARIVQLKYGLKGLIPDGMLIRVSSIDANPAQAFQVQAQFASDLIGAVDGRYRNRLGFK